MDTEKETLYLARGGKEDIFVEKCPKQQHVVDGIRFIYRQYVKKKPGLIINDTNSHSRRIQTVLFLSAVRTVLERPVLILCAEGKEEKWRDYFETWTDMGNDITTDTINPFSKKVSVYINPLHDITKFYSREWSGVIIDSEIVNKEILKDQINTKFKVWITGIDLKNDLTIFPQIYKWIYPKEKFDASIFKANIKDPRDVVAKAILLDSFMEDVVVRRNGVEDTVVKTPETPKVTRKNKDATGTKIKRTKRKIISSSEDDSPTKITKTKTASNDNNYQPITNNADICNTSNSRANIDDFQVTIEGTRTTKDGRSAIDDSRATIKSTTTAKYGTRAINNTRAPIDESTAIINVLSSTTVDSSKIRIEYYEEDTDQREEMEKASKSPVICNDDDNSIDLLLKYEVDDKYTPVLNKNNADKKDTNCYLDQEQESNDSIYDRDTQENKDENLQFKHPVSCHDSINVTKSNPEDNIPKLMEIVDKEQNIQNNNKNKETSKQLKESEDVFSTESITTLNEISNQNEIQQTTNIININKNGNEINKELTKQIKQSEDLFTTESLSHLNKITDQNNVVKDSVGNKETDPSTSLDNKIKLMEELAMKKFKGSLLDSIF